MTAKISSSDGLSPLFQLTVGLGPAVKGVAFGGDIAGGGADKAA